jgi:hypothetical protein
MPEATALKQPAGDGRSAPNDFPVLPPPVRFKFNLLRPDLIVLNVLGPQLFTQIVVVLVIVLFAYFAVMDLPLILTILASNGVGRR